MADAAILQLAIATILRRNRGVSLRGSCAPEFQLGVGLTICGAFACKVNAMAVAAAAACSCSSLAYHPHCGGGAAACTASPVFMRLPSRSSAMAAKAAPYPSDGANRVILIVSNI